MKPLNPEIKFAGSGGIFDLMDNVVKAGFNITDDQFDFICEEATDEEIKNTDKTRWERLPVGQNLLDLEISLDDFANAVKFLSFGFAKNKGKEQGAGAAPGGMPGMASRKLDNMVKLAQNLDLFGMYSVADRIL
jgi:hypothetical protein